jgi:hypothetical protein
VEGIFKATSDSRGSLIFRNLRWLAWIATPIQVNFEDPFPLQPSQLFLKTGLIFCRVFLNRQSAVAHQHVFECIDEIVYEDTGRKLQWRHLNAASIDDFDDMVLQWAADQHRGQAKGESLRLLLSILRLIFKALVFIYKRWQPKCLSKQTSMSRHIPSKV